MAIAQFVVTTLVALIGLYLAHSYRRQQRLRIAERRLDAYGALWKLMEVARPTRIAADASVDRAHGALTRNEAVSLYKSMTHWYFGSANGLLLPDATKRLYLEVKSRLGEYAEGRDSAAEEQGKRRMTEIGLLRAQMRLDLDIYSEPYLSSSNPKNKELERKLLEAAKIDSRGWGTAVEDAGSRTHPADGAALYRRPSTPCCDLYTFGKGCERGARTRHAAGGSLTPTD